MNKSKLLFASAILSTLYLFIIVYYFNELNSSNGIGEFGDRIIAVLIVPHMFILFVAVFFNWIGWAKKSDWSALTCGILYCASALLFVFFSPALILQIIFSFMGYSNMKRDKYLLMIKEGRLNKDGNLNL